MADGTHSYFDWQVSTLMLAYDVIDPIPRQEDRRIAERQRSVDQEIHDLAQATIPDAYKANPELEFPPAVVMLVPGGIENEPYNGRRPSNIGIRRA